jgi:ABC-type uncharacterized transport system permease subunit
MLVSYSVALAVSAPVQDAQQNQRSSLSPDIVGLVGILAAILIVVLFSTAPFLRMRMVCARPHLYKQLEVNPNTTVISVMLMGYALSAISGLLCAWSLGTSSSEMADDKMFLALTSLILGESVLALFVRLALLAQRRLSFFGSSLRHRNHWKLRPGYAANTPYLMAAAVLGSPLYWIIFSGATGFLHISTDWNKLFLGVSIVVVLVFTRLTPQMGIFIEDWAFQQERSW